jgi:hypothetical protein
VPLVAATVTDAAAGGGGQPRPGPEVPETEVDSADAARPMALAEDFELTADSLELTAPAEVVERIFAAGQARSISHARDSLNVDALPEIARFDWLEGDTIVISLARVGAAGDTVAGADSAEAEYEVERVVARVGARSLYRLPPEDSAAVAGIDPPAVHYVMGDEITLILEDGEVQAMEVKGQTRGVHLEPLGAEPDSLAADTAAVSANDFTFAGHGGGGDAPTPAPWGAPPARGTRPWIRR